MTWIPQRTYESRFAWSPNKESAYGTVLADAKFTRSSILSGFDFPEISKTFRSNAGALFKGHEFPTEREQVRQDLRYAVNAELSALLFGQVAAFCLGTDSPTLLETGVYEHVIIFMDPALDGRDLPSTGHYFFPSADQDTTTKGAVCPNFSVSYTRGQPLCQIASTWIGSGEYDNAAPSPVPDLSTAAEMGYLFEKDLEITLGTPGGEVSVKDRIAAFSVEFSNGAADKAEAGYYAGSGLYRGRLWTGARQVVPKFTMLSIDTDDLLTLFTNDTTQGLRITWEGALLGATKKHKIDIYIPNIKFGGPWKSIEVNGEAAVEISPGAEGVFKTPATEICTITVQNAEAAYLTA